MRGWLLMRMTGGMVALLTGPWQFWSGFRTRYPPASLDGPAISRRRGRRLPGRLRYGRQHHLRLGTRRWPGRSGNGVGYNGRYGVLRYPEKAHPHSQGMDGTRLRCHLCLGNIPVAARLQSAFSSQPENDLSITLIWASWAIPLLVAEVILQLRRMRSAVTSG